MLLFVIRIYSKVLGLGAEYVFDSNGVMSKFPHLWTSLNFWTLRERLIGSVRRECLNHVIVLNERHLIRILDSYFEYYHNSRTHLSLNRNSPFEREVEPPEQGKIISIPQVGGLHHRYR